VFFCHFKVHPSHALVVEIIIDQNNQHFFGFTLILLIKLKESFENSKHKLNYKIHNNVLHFAYNNVSRISPLLSVVDFEQLVIANVSQLDTLRAHSKQLLAEGGFAAAG